MASKFPYNLSIIIPCYNPLHEMSNSISNNFNDIGNSIRADIELIIVNDGSTRNFDEEKIKSFFPANSAVKVVSYSDNKGKGYALREGIKSASGEFIIYTDVDFPYTLTSLQKIYSALINDSADIAMGIRNKEYYLHIPAARVKISKLLRFFIKKFLRIPTDDTQCGLKGFNQKGKDIFLQTTINRYLFDLEFIFLAARKKIFVKTVEVELRPGIELSSMNWKILFNEAGNFVKIFLRGIF